MELILNLVWCLIIVAAAVRFTIWSAGRPAPQRVIVGLATVCILALLFPIISVTDDLHNSPAVFEETRTAPISLVVALVIIVVAVVFACRLRLVRAIAAEEPIHRVLDGVRTAIAVRPPPVFVR